MKQRVGGQANEPSSCSGSHLLETLPPPGTPGANRDTRVDGRGGAVTYNQNWGSQIEPPLLFPTIAPSHPQAWLLSRNKKRGLGDGQGDGEFRELVDFPVRSQ